MSGPVVIVGGGIGGLAAALAIRRRSKVECRVYERAPELHEVGAGLLLTPNAVGVLEQLDLRRACEQRGTLIRQWRILDRRGRLLHRLVPTGRLGSMALHRADLQMALLGALPEGVVTLGHEAAQVADGNGCTEVTFTSRCSVSAEMVVGADGVRSRVRDYVHHRRPGAVAYRGYVGWRAVVPWTPCGYEDGWLSESWAHGARFGITPIGQGRCYWYATANAPEGMLLEPQGRKEDLLRRFEGRHEPVEELIQATPAEAILLNDIADGPFTRPWQRDGVALLGDAAHPLTPNLGQGAAMALEDAWALAGCLHRHGPSSRALQEYQSRRRARVIAMGWASRFLGGVIQLENPFLTTARDALLRITPEAISDATLQHLFRFHD